MWSTFGSMVLGAVIALVGAWWNSWLSEYRERRKRLEECRLDLYLEVVGLFPRIEYYLDTGTRERFFGSEDQRVDTLLTHRIYLIGSDQVVSAHREWRRILHGCLNRQPGDSAYVDYHDRLDDARNSLKEEMRCDFADVLRRSSPPWVRLVNWFQGRLSARAEKAN